MHNFITSLVLIFALAYSAQAEEVFPPSLSSREGARGGHCLDSQCEASRNRSLERDQYHPVAQQILSEYRRFGFVSQQSDLHQTEPDFFEGGAGLVYLRRELRKYFSDLGLEMKKTKILVDFATKRQEFARVVNGKSEIIKRYPTAFEVSKKVGEMRSNSSDSL
jgi:hypothetical protein